MNEMLKHFEKLQETPLTRFFDLQFRSLEGMLDRDLVRLGHEPYNGSSKKAKETE